MRYRLKKLQQLWEAIVGDSALLGKVMVVCRDEFADGHYAGWLTLQQVNDLSAKLDELRVSYWTFAALNPGLCTTQTHTLVQSWHNATVLGSVCQSPMMITNQKSVQAVCCAAIWWLWNHFEQWLWWRWERRWWDAPEERHPRSFHCRESAGWTQPHSSLENYMWKETIYQDTPDDYNDLMNHVGVRLYLRRGSVPPCDSSRWLSSEAKVLSDITTNGIL